MYTSARTQTIQTSDHYMNEVGRYPLLSHDQEIELAAQVETGRTARRTLAEKPGLRAETKLALIRAVARGEQARRQLIECNLRLVIHMARRYIGCGLPLEDLVQEGNVGLIEAVERYDHRRDVRLATYAGWWIKRALLKALSDQGRPITMPLWANDERLRLRRATIPLEMRLERPPTSEELAAELGLPTPQVRRLQRWDRTFLSLEAPLSSNAEYTLGETLPDPDTPGLDETMTRLELQARLREIMDTYLGPTERTYLRIRFGLDGGPGHTLRQAAHEMGISQRHASALEKRALRQLRHTGALHVFW